MYDFMYLVTHTIDSLGLSMNCAGSFLYMQTIVRCGNDPFGNNCAIIFITSLCYKCC